MNNILISPAFYKNNIPVVFSTDANFVPQLYVAIKSLIEHSSKNNNYDIHILYDGLSEHHKEVFNDFIDTNVSIRFTDMHDYMQEHKDKWYIHNWGNGKWHSLSVYYRFFIPEIFSKYEKVIFLDGDIIVQTDIAQLYKIDLKKNWVGAVQDFSRFVKGDVIAAYAEETLKVPAIQYFNAGILLFNIRELSHIHFLEKCLDVLQKLGKPLLNDQDVFNVVFKDKVQYLSFDWNCLFWNVIYCRKNAKENLERDIYQKFEESAKNAKIFHFAGGRKPWFEPNLQYAHIFWQYARQTPFYEVLLLDMFKRQINISIPMLPHVFRRHEYKMKYYKYKFLKYFVFGKKRKKYKDKKRKYKKLLKDIRQFMKKVS